MGKNEKKEKAAPEVKVEVSSAEVVVEHVTKVEKKSRWTLEACVKAAKRFQTREDWAERAPSSYKAALARGFVPQCTKHMQGKPVRKVGPAPKQAPARLPKAG